MPYKDPEKHREWSRRYRQEHPEQIKETSKRYYQNHREKVLKDNKKYRVKNPEKTKERSKKYRVKNPEKTKKYSREYKQRPENKEKLKKSSNTYKNNNKEKLKKIRERPEKKEERRLYSKEYRQRPETKEKVRLYQRKRRKNPLRKLSGNISNGISSSLKSNNLSKNRIHYEDLIINTFQEIKEHLEKNFLPGMTLKNHGKWVIDHIIPISFFQFTSTDDVEFKYCWSIENLQPMWKKDNQEKGDKIILWGKEINARNIEKDYFSKIIY